MKRLLMFAVILAFTTAVHAAKIVKEKMTSAGAERTYYLFVPDQVKDNPPPLVILLHGSGRYGRILVEHWESIAKKEGIILAGPDATVSQGWSNRDDGPLLFRDLVDALRGRGARVETGRFGATMTVTSSNDGPFTVIVEI